MHLRHRGGLSLTVDDEMEFVRWGSLVGIDHVLARDVPACYIRNSVIGFEDTVLCNEQTLSVLCEVVNQVDVSVVLPVVLWDHNVHAVKISS